MAEKDGWVHLASTDPIGLSLSCPWHRARSLVGSLVSSCCPLLGPLRLMSSLKPRSFYSNALVDHSVTRRTGRHTSLFLQRTQGKPLLNIVG